MFIAKAGSCARLRVGIEWSSSRRRWHPWPPAARIRPPRASPGAGPTTLLGEPGSNPSRRVQRTRSPSVLSYFETKVTSSPPSPRVSTASLRIRQRKVHFLFYELCCEFCLRYASLLPFSISFSLISYTLLKPQMGKGRIGLLPVSRA